MEQSDLENFRTIYSKNYNQTLLDFKKFLSFQSISSEAAFKVEVERCASWLKNYIENIGFKCDLWQTNGHPVLYAHWLDAGPDKPTLLIYNHYDVQPVDPLDEWETPPFEPTVRNGEVYARGAQDNKGQCFFVLQALRLLMERDGKLPINIKLCIEGEEESGSLGLSKVLSTRKKELKADYLAVVDLDIKGPNEPSITLGFRGIISMDVEAIGSQVDLHSGQHGGIVYNPIHALIEIFSKLRDENGKIQVPGFYDSVINLSKSELNQISLDFNDKKYESEFGGKPTGGELKYSPYERNWLRPTIEINGISGGYSGSGFKTVIPAKASAKVSCRLVPNQDPQDIAKKVSSFIEKNAPNGIRVQVKIHSGGGKAVCSKASSKIVKAFSAAFSDIFEKPCEFIYTGGSIPVITELAKASESEVVLIGMGLATDRIHAPNEHFGIDRLEKGALMMARAIELLSNV